MSGGARSGADGPDGADLPEVFRSGTKGRYPGGFVLFNQGDSVDTVHVIENGVVRVGRSEGTGEHVLTRFLGPGSVAGLVGMLSDGVHDASAECVGVCELRPLSRREVERALGTDPAIHRWIARRLAAEHQDRNLIASLRGHRDSTVRFRLLVELCPGVKRVPQPDGSLKIVVPLLNQDLAALLDVTPQHFSRLLRRWTAEGIVRRENGALVVPADVPRRKER